jgi:hypothetical protein
VYLEIVSYVAKEKAELKSQSLVFYFKGYVKSLEDIKQGSDTA